MCGIASFPLICAFSGLLVQRFYIQTKDKIILINAAGGIDVFFDFARYC